MFNHSWSMNPFAYFGDRLFATIHAATGAGLLAFVWWVARIALDLLRARWGEMDAWSAGFFYGFQAGGVLALASLLYVHVVIARELRALAAASPNPQWGVTERGFRRVAAVRVGFILIFSALGWGALYAFRNIGA